jgi:RNA polymerase sigma-70 factor (ECF subfamily)
VLAIVRNTAYTSMAKRRAAQTVSVEELDKRSRMRVEYPDGAADRSPSPDAYLIARVEAAHLEKAIAALPGEFREPLILREMQGLGYREIAEVTGVPIGTVMSRLSRARERLMKTMQDDR